MFKARRRDRTEDSQVLGIFQVQVTLQLFDLSCFGIMILPDGRLSRFKSIIDSQALVSVAVGLVRCEARNLIPTGEIVR